MVRGSYNRYAANGVYKNFGNKNSMYNFGGMPATATNDAGNFQRQMNIYRYNQRNRRNFDYERSRGRFGGNLANQNGYTLKSSFFRTRRLGILNRRGNSFGGIGKRWYNRGGANRFRTRMNNQGYQQQLAFKGANVSGTIGNANRKQNSQNAATAVRLGGLEEAIMSSRRNAKQRRNFGGFRRGNGRRRGNWRFSRGAMGGAQGTGSKNFKDSLDAQLDTYMGDDAVKSRLDMDLDHYFGRDNIEMKRDGDMADYAVADVAMDRVL